MWKGTHPEVYGQHKVDSGNFRPKRKKPKLGRYGSRVYLRGAGGWVNMIKLYLIKFPMK